ncbi:MAG: DUF134 domain-containing protein [Clostridia bacterium]|nr:DUF134 domain-containing protein [Clostridia bacterium]
MNVARTTVTRMYGSARKKIAEALVKGSQISIRGGDISVCAAIRPECADAPNCCHKLAQNAAPDTRTIPTSEDITRVKGLGFLRDKTTDNCFNGRVITRNGKITADQSQIIAEAAKRFGNGEIAMTTRLTVEIQRVPYENIEPLCAFLAEHGLETGGTGPKVRPIVSCKGTTCQYGLIDTYALSEEIHERFYRGWHDVKLPHKFKIAVGGCPNNCVKPDLNDLGIVGQRLVKIDYEKCRGCKVCQIEKGCPIKVAHLEDGRITVPADACNHCGRCKGKCPFHVFDEYTDGYRVYIGGRWGKKVAQGRPLSTIFTSKEEVLAVLEKAIVLFRDQGIAGERFADTVNRLGFEAVEKQLLGENA